MKTLINITIIININMGIYIPMNINSPIKKYFTKSFRGDTDVNIFHIAIQGNVNAPTKRLLINIY